jgi:RNA polymerase subunit RPABC4/transcription elongation factor Spt4
MNEEIKTYHCNDCGHICRTTISQGCAKCKSNNLTSESTIELERKLRQVLDEPSPIPKIYSDGGRTVIEYEYTEYRCGNCKRLVSKTTQVCPHCSVRLVGIRSGYEKSEPKRERGPILKFLEGIMVIVFLLGFLGLAIFLFILILRISESP